MSNVFIMETFSFKPPGPNFIGISKQKQAVKDKAKEAERKNSQAYSHKVCNLFEAEMYIALLKIHVLYTFHRRLLR